MLNQYIKHAYRSLERNRVYTILNIAGLAAGLTCFAFIALWVKDELSFDKFNVNYDQIYRLTGTVKTETGTELNAVSSAPMAKALRDDYPEVENAVRVDMREEIIRHKNEQTLQPDILITEPAFFEIFSYSLLRGDAKTALRDPFTIVLTESTAKKYFGDTDPIGQSLVINMNDSTNAGAAYTVTGLMSDPPENAHLRFTMMASFSTVEAVHPDILTADGWGDGSYYTYLLLKKGTNYKEFSKKISHFYKKYIGDQFAAWEPIYSYQLQPLADIHLRSGLQYEISANGDINQVYIFSAVGIFILLLACINYINLATARAAGRSKEVSIKKVVGAMKSQLIFQYLAESVITALSALVVACIFVLLLEPFFYQVTGKHLSIFGSPVLLAFLISATLLSGVVSGVYPAFVISGFKPAITLKGAFSNSPKGSFLRKTLVVSQFTITLVLITGIVIIYSQFSFIKNKDLGYDKNGLMFLRVHGNAEVVQGYEAFKNELLSSPLIQGAATSNSLLGSLGSGGAETSDDKGNLLRVNTARLRVDAGYFHVHGMKFVAGTGFKENPAKEALQLIILNETAVTVFGWKTVDAAVGKPFKMGDRNGIVTGVVKNFHYNDMHQFIGPLAIYLLDQSFSRITLKTKVNDPTATADWVKAIWKKHFSTALLDYDFYDQTLESDYQSEQRFARILLYFSLLSLLIGCLGLYGLIAYTTSQKTKEIGIRKVLGATVENITVMLSAGFLKLVVIAFFIAIPIAWFVMNKWLENFAYRTDVAWWMFAISGAIVILIALMTVSYHSVRAAMQKPSGSLKAQ